MDLKLEGKRALVTGASSGIGKETALTLAREGASVVVAGRNRERTEATAGLISDAGGRAVVAIGDLTTDDGANAIADAAVEALGGIDILVNNAGVGLEGPIIKATYADYDFGFGVNVGGVINGFVSFLPQMIGFKPPGGVYTHIVGTDIVRTGEDQFYVLEDNARTPSGVSYMLENRETMMQMFPELFHLNKVRPVEDVSLMATPSKREEPRIPFGWLVERGLLHPGDLLVSPNNQWTAKVRADGTLISADHRGSIHQVGAAVQGAPACNGWQFWCLRMEGKLVPIDFLRQRLRAELS